MKKYIHIAIMAITATTLFMFYGCFVPEDYEANVKVNNDKSYIFTYEGNLIFVLALDAALEEGLDQEDEAELKEIEEEFRQDPDFTKVEYIGNARYKVSVKKVGQPGERYEFLEIFNIETNNEGLLIISADRPSEEDINELVDMGIKMNGTLTVTVPRGIEVVEHNADSEPKLFGLLGSYKWELDSIADANPYIVLK